MLTFSVATIITSGIVQRWLDCLSDARLRWYEIPARIGKGAMGEVWKVKDVD
jgi:hypothetical protein